MTERLDFYRCEICGNIVQIMHSGADAFVCCEKPMTKIKPHTKAEEKQEKHVPVFVDENTIQVGTELHPMTEEHHIEFIQAVSDDKKHIYTKFLNSDEQPVMKINNKYDFAVEYCSLHGLWQSK